MLLMGSIFLVLLLLGMPIAFTIGISAMAFVFTEEFIPLTIAVQKMISSTQSFPLLAVPFFVLAGNLMNATGITSRLITFAHVLTGHLIGGLAHVSVVLSALMGGISGSAVADAAMESRLLGPSMIKAGYSKGYAAAVIALSSLITATIPPSIGLILYGFVGEVSIGKLFIGGIVPGLLMTFILMGVSWLTAKNRGYGRARETRATLPEFKEAFKESFLALLFPLILIVGIRFGIFTPSEAGAFAAVYAFVVGKFVYKELTWETLKEVLRQTVRDNGIIMLIITCSGIFGYAIVYNRMPQTIAQWLLGVTNSPGLLLFIVLTFLFIAGM
ncbi:MAG TPA: TRAP transporter large permease subunit, partial [Aminobacteriaceae bacterium]|nr:TRAP transporter large permease subunit [Aminobacteriaceae bacterium]